MSPFNVVLPLNKCCFLKSQHLFYLLLFSTNQERCNQVPMSAVMIIFHLKKYFFTVSHILLYRGYFNFGMELTASIYTHLYYRLRSALIGVIHSFLSERTTKTHRSSSLKKYAFIEFSFLFTKHISLI